MIKLDWTEHDELPGSVWVTQFAYGEADIEETADGLWTWCLVISTPYRRLKIEPTEQWLCSSLQGAKNAVQRELDKHLVDIP